MKKTFYLLSVLTFLLIVVLATLQQKAKEQIPPLLGEVPGFTLTDSNGRNFGLDNLKGSVWVADFIFTTCGSVCPIMSRHMSAIYQAYHVNPGAQFVSISVNPEFDTPQVLAKYAERYKANTAKWHFLTGERKTISDLAVLGFKIGSVAQPVFHSTYFVLVDRQAKIRGYYDGTKPQDIQKLLRDVYFCLRESK